MYFPPLMGFGIDHAAMINVLAHQLLSGLGTKPVRSAEVKVIHQTR